MSTLNISLILISGLGVLHGMFLAIYLWTYKKGNNLSNKILSLLLVALSFRIGKSVFLEFADHLHIKMVFIGLAVLMSIGPLFLLFTASCIDKNFKVEKRHFLHFIPTLIGVIFGLWVTKSEVSSLPKAFLVCLLLTYYIQYILYILISYFSVLKHKKKGKLTPNTFELLRLLFVGLLVIWLAYFLNLLDDIVPYIIGPILYTIIAYTISFIIIKKGYHNFFVAPKYKTNPVSKEQITEIFRKVENFILIGQEYKNPNISLKLLSDKFKVSPQVLSMIINTKSNTNFNSFVNNLRIKEALKLLQTSQYENQTISSIAFDVGFNSISSFNTAFKKQTGKTPSSFRKDILK